MQQFLTNELFRNSEKLTGFEFTHSTLKRLYEFDITISAKLVLVFLTTFYNAEKNGAVVFPSIQHIADTLGIGQTAVKQAIKDLVQNGLILKSKLNKTGNHNKYVFALKVQNPTVKQSESDRFMNRTSNMKKVKEQTAKVCTNTIRFAKGEIMTGGSRRNDSLGRKHFQDTNVVVFQKKRTVTDAEVPNFIKENKSIKNPCAYWASLSNEVKAELIKKDADVKAAAQKKEEEKRKKEQLRIAEVQERELLKSMTLSEKYTKEQAIALIKAMPAEIRKISKVAMELTELYNL